MEFLKVKENRELPLRCHLPQDVSTGVQFHDVLCRCPWWCGGGAATATRLLRLLDLEVDVVVVESIKIRILLIAKRLFSPPLGRARRKVAFRHAHAHDERG
ncbi:unnamed protein product [Ectocarpus sp. 13 AM-2016]